MLEKGINLIGYFDKAFGLGETSRLFIKALQARSIPFALLSADDLAPFHQSAFFQADLSKDFAFPVNLFCIDPHHIAPFIEKFPWKKVKHCYNIAVWFWETNLIPESMKDGWCYLDEMWVTSRYIQEHLSSHTSLPIHCLCHPLQRSASLDIPNKQRFNLPNKFTFLFFFDFYSVFARKNPLALIQAFQKAFPTQQDVQLVIKSQNGHQFPHQLEPMRELTRSDPRLIWIDRSLESNERYALMNACDCYISLHRSEGFGLTMAEAMLLEKPVIATRYSGNLEFMSDQNSFLCSYQLTQIGPGHAPYPENGLWADVDINHAAHWMRYVASHPHEASQKAQQGKATILQNYSCEKVGQQIQARLNAIYSHPVSKRMPVRFMKKKMKDAAYATLFFLRRSFWKSLINKMLPLPKPYKK
ncbi:glycosyltransferase family 4 protein [Candidatus Protochlamydia phocaeensis]|uniref:glycosyltransferase family 4 protein n=1 Tax=Candidatus Protochlamydia phocaeensis TaxID=1414722 RepID=UPI0008388780|nr:glycosyltransferase family 4 protein [Candidatus Protochlamydia phocaeensis]